MANNKKRLEKPKKSYGYRTTETKQSGYKEKAAKEKVTLSSKIEQLLDNWVNGFHP